MGRCKFCGNKAGFLKDYHKDCEEMNSNSKKQILKLANHYFDQGQRVTKKEISKIAKSGFLVKKDVINLLANVYDNILEKNLKNGGLSYEVEQKLVSFSDYYEIPESILDIRDSVSKTVKASILREAGTTGDVFNRLHVDELPIMMQKNEDLVYIFYNVEYLEEKTSTSYEGSSDGFSVRLAKGLYYRKSAYKGRPVKETGIEFVSKGILFLTDKHIYFWSPSKTLKIKFQKIISLTPYEDGLGVQTEGVRSKPQFFRNLDGQFCSSFIKKISRI